jgi:Ca-activated chloride channel family protein
MEVPMKKRDESIEAVGRSEFVDEEAGALRVRAIQSGRGAVSRRGFWRRAARELEPEIVCGEDGRLGWRVRLPGGRPLSTPALAGGLVLIGGGFGSHDFFAFEAASGRLRYRLRTKDDGPTAAAVLGSRAAFNTESCTVYVVDAESGRVLWEKWLGDPLMAQPAMWGSSVFMAYPDRERRHWLAAYDVATGDERWKTAVNADLISAPIAAGGSVYAAAIDGTVYRIDGESGRRLWSMPHRATSAPWIHEGKIYMSLREELGREAGGSIVEGLATATLGEGARHSHAAYSRRRAAYLRQAHDEEAQAYFTAQDAGVGFAAAPSSAKLHMAQEHLGLGRVASVWSFQGSRPEVFDDGIFAVLDDVVQRLDVESKKPLWRSRLEFEGGRALSRAFSPPALSATRLYLASALGDLIVLDRASGDELWALNAGAPILHQPAVGEGKVFFGTADGVLYAFETGDPDPRGWPMWGGGPGHNG